MSVWLKLIVNSALADKKNLSSKCVEAEAITLIEFELKKLDAHIETLDNDIAVQEREKKNIIRAQGLCNERIEQLQKLIDQHRDAGENSLVEMLEDEQQSQRVTERAELKKVQQAEKKIAEIAKEKVIQVLDRRRLSQQMDTLKAFERMQNAKLQLAKKKDHSGKLITAIDILRK